VDYLALVENRHCGDRGHRANARRWSSALARSGVTAARVGVALADLPIPIVDDVLDPAVNRHLAASRLRVDLPPGRVRDALTSCDAVGPAVPVGHRVDISLCH
jgi:hypothetical protein